VRQKAVNRDRLLPLAHLQPENLRARGEDLLTPATRGELRRPCGRTRIPLITTPPWAWPPSAEGEGT